MAWHTAPRPPDGNPTSSRGWAGGLPHLRAHAKGAETRGAARRDMVGHVGGQGRPVQGGGAGVPVNLRADGEVEAAGEQQSLTTVRAAVTVVAEKCQGGPATSVRSARRRSVADMAAPPHCQRAPWPTTESSG
jgi:hypothetical protein